MLNSTVKLLRCVRAVNVFEKQFQTKYTNHGPLSSAKHCITGKSNFEQTTAGNVQIVRKFSSDAKSGGSGLFIKNDSEVTTWMNQISQDFKQGKEPFQVDGVPGKSSKNDGSKSQASRHTGTMLNADTADIEEFGYFDENQEVSVVAPQRCFPISLERGKHGVFDVEEIVKVLEDDLGIDVKVIDVPPELRFVNHMVVVSGKSLRHMRAMAATIELLYKKKKSESDREFKLEGRDCSDWLAMDLGNIALHIFTPEARQHYDLETLWTLGPEHDDQRHYVQDQHVNLTAEELFWLESAWNTTSSKDEKIQNNKSASGTTSDSEREDSMFNASKSADVAQKSKKRLHQESRNNSKTSHELHTNDSSEKKPS